MTPARLRRHAAAVVALLLWGAWLCTSGEVRAAAADSPDWSHLPRRADLRGRATVRAVRVDGFAADRRYLAILPRDHRPEDGPLPVALLLHGLGGDPAGWVDLGQVVTRVDAAVEESLLPPCLLVIPEGGSGYWSDWKDGLHPFGTLVLRILDDARRHLPARQEASATAIVGISMGGFGALSIGLRHPERFGFVAGLSATDMAIALRARRLRKVYLDVFGDPPDKAMVASLNPIDLVTAGRGTRQQQFAVAWGTREAPKFKEGSERLTAAMKRRRLRVRSLAVRDGRHGWASAWQPAHPWWISLLGRAWLSMPAADSSKPK